MISPSERVIALVEAGIGWLVFNNPERRNAVSLDMWEAISVIIQMGKPPALLGDSQSLTVPGVGSSLQTVSR